jgi:hypothetical protein
MATSVNMIWSGLTPLAAASAEFFWGHADINSIVLIGRFRYQLETTKKQTGVSSVHLRALTLVSPAAGNLKSHNALLGTRLRMLHLKKYVRLSSIKASLVNMIK